MDDLSALLATHGAELAHVDDTVYLSLQAVYACEPSKAPQFYCVERDWPTTPAARLTAKDKEIAELEAVLSRQAEESLKQFKRASAAEARIKELEAQLAARRAAETPLQNQTKMIERQAASLNGDTPPVDPIVCSDCGKGGWKNTHALDVHRGRAHAPAQFVEELGWRCAAKGCTGAHARDLHDPVFCTLHAAPHTNGHRSAADLEAAHDR